MQASMERAVSLLPPSYEWRNQRAEPRNPRRATENPPLEFVRRRLQHKFAPQKPTRDLGAPKLFSSEEKSALHRPRPELEKLCSDKWPILHTSATCGEVFSVDRLLKMGLDVNALDKDGYSVLQRAVLAKKETVVNILLRNKADAHICDKGGATLLHYSVQTGSSNLVRWFLESGVDVNAPDKHGWTPLHLAVLTGRADIVRLLLVRGADKKLSNQDGLTPLDLCFWLGKLFNSTEVARGLKTLPRGKRVNFDAIVEE